MRYFNTRDDFRCSRFHPFMITYFKKFHIFVTSFDERDNGSPPPPNPPAVAQATLSSVTLCLSLSQVDRVRALRNENPFQLVSTYMHTVHLDNYQSSFHRLMHNWIVLQTILNLR